MCYPPPPHPCPGQSCVTCYPPDLAAASRAHRARLASGTAIQPIVLLGPTLLTASSSLPCVTGGDDKDNDEEDSIAMTSSTGDLPLLLFHEPSRLLV